MKRWRFYLLGLVSLFLTATSFPACAVEPATENTASVTARPGHLDWLAHLRSKADLFPSEAFRKAFRKEFLKGNFAAAERDFRDLATDNDPYPMHGLGLMYCNGQGVVQDRQAGLEWFIKATRLGFSESAEELMQRLDRHSPEDQKILANICPVAARLPSLASRETLGWMFENGVGVPVDQKCAVYWYAKSVESIFKKGVGPLTTKFLAGLGVEENWPEAAYWLRQLRYDSQDFTMNQAVDMCRKHLPKTKMRPVEFLGSFLMLANDTDISANSKILDLSPYTVYRMLSVIDADRFPLGNSLEQDLVNVAKRWLASSTTDPDGDALRMADILLTSLSSPNVRQEGLAMLTRLGEKGYGPALVRLGQASFASPEGKDEAAMWFQKAGEAGFAEGWRRYGLHFRGKDHAPWDPDKLKDGLYAAARASDTEAMCALAEMSLDPGALGRNPDEALFWMKRAAALGSPRGEVLLAKHFLTTKDPEQETQAIRLLERAAIASDTEAMKQLITLYRRRGTPAELQRAQHWVQTGRATLDGDFWCLEASWLRQQGDELGELIVLLEGRELGSKLDFRDRKRFDSEPLYSRLDELKPDFMVLGALGGKGSLELAIMNARLQQREIETAGRDLPGCLGLLSQWQYTLRRDHRIQAEFLFPILLDHAKRGSPAACFYVGQLYGLSCFPFWDPALKEKFLREAAENGHPEACLRLGEGYLGLRGLAENASQARRFLEAAATGGQARAWAHLGFLAFHHQDFAEAFRCFSRGSEAGDTLARYGAGVCHAHGFGVQIDRRKAIDDLRGASSFYPPLVPVLKQVQRSLAAEGPIPGKTSTEVDDPYAKEREEQEEVNRIIELLAEEDSPLAELKTYLEANSKTIFEQARGEDPKARFLLALSFRFGFGTNRKRVRYFEQLLASAKLGCSQAQYLLAKEEGYLNAASNGPSKWLVEAAKQKHPFAMFTLGVILMSEMGNKDAPTLDPVNLFLEAAEAGVLEAKTRVGEWYLHGRPPTIATDVTRGLALLQEAVRAENPTGQRVMGLYMLDHPDIELASHPPEDLLRRAAEYDDPPAQLALARLLIGKQGKGTTNAKHAFFWFLVSRSNSTEGEGEVKEMEELRVRLTESLTTVEQEQEKQRAEIWKPKRVKDPMYQLGLGLNVHQFLQD